MAPSRKRSKALVELFPDLGPPPEAAPQAARTLLEMARAIPLAPTVGEAQRVQLQHVAALLAPKSCFVAQHAPGREQLQIAAVRGRNDARIAAARPGEGLAGQAYAQGRIVREDGALAIPIVGTSGSLGVLVVLGPRFDVPDVLAEALAAQLAAAWEHARLKDDTARRNKDLQTAVAGLKSMEKNREELLSNVSHDLKNPLTTLKAYLAMLGQGRLGEVSEKQAHAVGVCERNADRLLKMVNDLLLLSRLQSGRMQLAQRPFGLKILAGEVVQSLASVSEHLRVRIGVERAAEVFVKGDRERLFEAVQNVVEHAVQQSQAGGEVTICLEADQGLAVLTVRDEGMGLLPEDVDQLFETFHRSRSGMRAEIGLGMPIASKIVQLHGGRLEASSKLGEGTTLRVVLPAFAAAVSLAEQARAPRSGEILLVEDDQDCREVLQELLEQEGYSVLSAAGAEAARELLAGVHPAMVLLDLRLSEEDGRSVLRHIRAAPGLEQTPVYIISGASEVASLSTGTGLDRIDGFFEKPLQLPKLLDTVASVVRPVRAAPRLG